jgi:hypothetical protein
MEPYKYHGSYEDDVRFRRNVERVHGLGPRVLAEMLEELGRTSLHMTTIEQMVAFYAPIDPAVLSALGACKFPPRPDLRIVGGRDDD